MHLRVAKTVDKGLLAILEVLGVAHSPARIVHDFIHDLRNADRVGGRAFVACERTVSRSVSNVAAVILYNQGIA